MRLMPWLFMSVLALALSGCGMANHYATLANAAGGEALRNTIERRAEQNDSQLRAYEAGYCSGVSIGALTRRYRDPAVMTGYLRLCEAVRGLR